LSWREIDFGYGLIRALEALELAWDVKRPTAVMIARRLADCESPAESKG
jgi:hypothetical protein